MSKVSLYVACSYKNSSKYILCKNSREDSWHQVPCPRRWIQIFNVVDTHEAVVKYLKAHFPNNYTQISIEEFKDEHHIDTTTEKEYCILANNGELLYECGGAQAHYRYEWGGAMLTDNLVTFTTYSEAISFIDTHQLPKANNITVGITQQNVIDTLYW